MIKPAISDAQNAARSGRLFGCDQLAYYELDFANDSDFGTVTLRAVCAAGSNDHQKEYQLSKEVRFNPIPSILFVYPINGLIDNNTDIHTRTDDDFELTIQLGSTQENICVDKTGTVKDGGC